MSCDMKDPGRARRGTKRSETCADRNNARPHFGRRGEVERRDLAEKAPSGNGTSKASMMYIPRVESPVVCARHSRWRCPTVRASEVSVAGDCKGDALANRRHSANPESYWVVFGWKPASVVREFRVRGGLLTIEKRALKSWVEMGGLGGCRRA